jgi:uncharacterized membrane protein
LHDSKLKKNILHDGFLAGIYLKGFDGILEIIGGFLMMMTNPAGFNRIIVLLTQHELLEDPKDIIANFLVSNKITVSLQHFGVFYLLFHGAFKLFIVVILLQKKRWAYPFSMAFLFLFIGYQIYRYIYSGFLWLIVLSVFDAVLILLTWAEYKRLGN